MLSVFKVPFSFFSFFVSCAFSILKFCKAVHFVKLDVWGEAEAKASSHGLQGQGITVEQCKSCMFRTNKVRAQNSELIKLP